MSKKIKSINYYRSEINSFETDGSNKIYLFQTKEYDPAGHIINESEYKPNGVKELETKYEYDENQTLVSKQTFYLMEDSDEKMVHVYNEKGQKIRDENYFGEDLFENVNYEFDEKGNVTMQVRMDDENNEIERQETIYNAEGKILKQSFFANGELEREVELEYDENGICTKEKHFRIGDNARETIEYGYNEAGKKISSTSTDEENNVIGYIDVEYDERMNPIKYTTETSGFYNSKAVNQVSYDEQNRIVENEYIDIMNNYLMSKEKMVYDEEGNISEQEIFEISPQGGMKKTHYRLQLKYEFHVD